MVVQLVGLAAAISLDLYAMAILNNCDSELEIVIIWINTLFFSFCFCSQRERGKLRSLGRMPGDLHHQQDNLVYKH